MYDSQSKSLSITKSSTALARLSVPPWRAATFLEGLANLDTSNSRRVEAFIKRFADLLPTFDPKKPASDRSSSLTQFEIDIKSMLESVWKEPIPYMREARLMRVAAHETQYEAEKGRLVKDNFLMVLLFAVKNAHLLHYCQNPNCKKPYFVAQRGAQVYCSVPCSKPAQREAKTKWWREHGSARRKKSRKKRGKHAKATKA